MHYKHVRHAIKNMDIIFNYMPSFDIKSKKAIMFHLNLVSYE